MPIHKRKKHISALLSAATVVAVLASLLPFIFVRADEPVAAEVLISAGSGHVLVQKADGTVWAWGGNWASKLGDRTTQDRTEPMKLYDFNNVKALAAGGGHSAVLKDDDSVWTWGDNWAGQIGDGTYTDRKQPMQVNITDVTAIVARDETTVALKSDGTVWSWGYNLAYNDESGNKADWEYNCPMQIHGLSDIASIAEGSFYILALNSDGKVFGIGSNSNGQIGNGEYVFRRSVPAHSKKMTDIAAIAAGGAYSLALRNGTVWDWGKISSYVVTDISWYGHSEPQKMEMNKIIAIAVGITHAAALGKDGTVWTWGENEYGELGDGTNQNRVIPKRVPGLTDVVAIAVGSTFTLAMKRDGTLWTWGVRLGAPWVLTETWNSEEEDSYLSYNVEYDSVPTQVTLRGKPFNLLEPTQTIPGDVNCDGVIDIKDILTARDHIFGTIQLDAASLQAADIDGNKKLTVDDILGIRDIIFGGRLFSLS